MRFKEFNIMERKLSTAEKEERERIVLKLKKDKAGFKKRYGDDWENVMYATATNMAKKK